MVKKDKKKIDDSFKSGVQSLLWSYYFLNDKISTLPYFIKLTLVQIFFFSSWERGERVIGLKREISLSYNIGWSGVKEFHLMMRILL
jgi:hypothetical protein